VAVEDVAREDLLDLAPRDVDELDRDAEPADRLGHVVAAGAGRYVGGDVDGDLGLRGGLVPLADGDLAAALPQPAVGEEPHERGRRPVGLHGGGSAQAELPAEGARALVEHAAAQLELALHPAANARVFMQCGHALA
jgi:hypothetical protein